MREVRGPGGGGMGGGGEALQALGQLELEGFEDRNCGHVLKQVVPVNYGVGGRRIPSCIELG